MRLPFRTSRPHASPSRSLSRRSLLGASAAGVASAAAGAAAFGAVVPAADPPPRANSAQLPQRWEGEPGSSGVRLRWLGNNGWEIRFGSEAKPTTVLIDPWLTRFKTGTYTPEGADPNTPISVDTGLIDSHQLCADHILVTHGHYDHMTDVPYIAAKTGATVFGTESHVNMMRALGAPQGQLSVVHGGEFLQFDGYTIRVLRSLHSMTGPRTQIPFPGTRPGYPPPRPKVISDLVEGETLAYLITVGNRFSVINFGGSNFSAQELEGLRPDLAIIQPGGKSVHDYVPRLLESLDYPPHVLPTHWDDFDHPLDEPAKDWGGLTALQNAIRDASPSSLFVRLEHLESYTA